MGSWAARVATWPLAAVGLAGIGLRIALAMRPDTSHDGRKAALVIAIASSVALAAAWMIERARVRRGERAVGLDARKATLLRHSDPLAAEVAEHGRAITCMRGQVTFLASMLTGAAEGYEIPEDGQDVTMPMLKAVGSKRDSA